MINRTFDKVKRFALNVRDLDKVVINQGRILSRDYAKVEFADLRMAEFQVFSQWGEDGIIQYLIQNLDIAHKTFVEFGVETFREANCRFLMINDYWRGLVIDGSEDNIRIINGSPEMWKYGLQTVCAFIDRDNIVDLIDSANFAGVGILSVDIDGVDYHVLERAMACDPDVVIVEYNSTFGPNATVSVPYDKDFYRTKAHHSNLYYGASAAGFDWFLSKQGYSLVAGNSAGNNLFFVRQSLLNDRVKAITPKDAFAEACFSESRDAQGGLTHLPYSARRKEIAEMPLIDVSTGAEIRVGDIPA
tara:strand:+ start:2265 stop:3173 length:909 start_codon:yes stop_codon:yes gene_type:complete